MNFVKGGNVAFYFAPQGTALKASDKVAHVENIGDVGSTVESVEVTDMDSVAKEFVASGMDNGEVALTINVATDNIAKIKEAFRKGTQLTCAIIYEDAPELSVEFNGFFNSFKVNGVSYGDKLQVAVTVTVSGEFKDATAPTPETLF